MRGGDVVRSPLDKCLACCLTIALLALPATARAQIAGAQYCSSDVFNDNPPIEGANPIDRMHPLLGRARYAEQVRNEQWTEALRGLRSDAMQAFVAAGVAPAHQLTFLAQLDSVLDVLPRLPPTGAGDARARFVADSVRSIRFQPVQGVSSYQLFRRAERIDIAGLGADQAKALCWSALSADLALFRLAKPLELESLARLARLNTSWANYRSYGYTRQPLELLLTPGSVHDSLPRAGQWLIGHLSLGLQVSGASADSLTTDDAAVIEFGRLWYRSNYTQYAGASAVVGLPARNVIGYGAMVHVARGLRGGMLFRRSNGRTTRSFIMSTDLYGMLERSKRSVEEGLAIARGLVVLPSRDGK